MLRRRRVEVPEGGDDGRIPSPATCDDDDGDEKRTGQAFLIVVVIVLTVTAIALLLLLIGTFVHSDTGSPEKAKAAAGPDSLDAAITIESSGRSTADIPLDEHDGGGSSSTMRKSNVCRRNESSFLMPPKRDCGEERARQFWMDCDWGLVDKYRGQLEPRPLTNGKNGSSSSSSSLRCVVDRNRYQFCRYCEGKQVMLDLSNDTDSALFGPRGDWTSLLPAFRPWDGGTATAECDVHFPSKTILLKPDSHANFYHALCDYIGVYATMHIPTNWTEPAFQSSSHGNYIYSYPTDLQLIMTPGFGRKSSQELFRSQFLSLYEPYTTKPVLTLDKHWQEGSKLCFDDVVLGLNSRGGPQSLFYNMYVPGDCSASHLFRSWVNFVTNNKSTLQPRDSSLTAGSLRGEPIQISIVTRNSGTGKTSGTRHIVNQEELIQAMQKRFGGAVNIRVLDYDFSRSVPVDVQVQGILDTDILVSMHGSGLAHLSFLPVFGVAFEIFNCGDPGCYSSLSRLKGIKYMTMPKEHVTKVKPKVAVKDEQMKNLKFWNYVIHLNPFLQKIDEAMNYLYRNPKSPYNACNEPAVTSS